MKKPTLVQTFDRRITAPTTHATRAQLLINGGQFFPAIIQAIDAAKHFIYIELYLVESGQITQQVLQALANASSRGVNIYMLLDGIGSRKLKQRDRDFIQSANIKLVFFNPMGEKKLFALLNRDHRKIIVADNSVGFIGGAGIADEFSQRHSPKDYWREIMCELEGEVVIALARLFEKSWSFETKQELSYANLFQPSALLHAPPDQPRFAATIVPSEGLGRQFIKRSVLNHVRRAKGRVWIATAYFYPSQKLRRALKQAAQRGLDVRILVPGRYTDHPAMREAGRFYYAKLLDMGVRIFEYEPRFLHMKCVICDDWVSLGSCNLDRWNQRWNLEANVEIRTDAFIKQAEVMFSADLAMANEIDKTLWSKRPVLAKLQSAFWATAWRWLERFLSNQRRSM